MEVELNSILLLMCSFVNTAVLLYAVQCQEWIWCPR